MNLELVQKVLEVSEAQPFDFAKLRARGIAPSWGPVTREKYARAEIRDPDGNAIELRQWM